MSSANIVTLQISLVWNLNNILLVLFTMIAFCSCEGLGRIAGILSLEAENDVPLDALRSVGSSLAMHIVAAKPLFLSKELVSSEALESERDILKSQVFYVTFL